MGFIQEESDKCTPMKPETVLKILEELAAGAFCGTSKNMFETVNTLETRNEEKAVWLSTMRLYWPVSFTVTAEARDMTSAFQEVCLLVAMKLKKIIRYSARTSNDFCQALFAAFKLLDQTNQALKLKIVNGMKQACMSVSDDFQPDAEIYSDASVNGMGAYFLSRDDDSVRWIAESWPENLYFSPEDSSDLNEFYALVSAVLTWKHKLMNKKLFCYSDNSYTVKVVNDGLYSFRRVQRSNCPDAKIAKLFWALTDTCKRNNITLVAKHIYRRDNIAADLLSRNQVKLFQTIVPLAKPVKKKMKKLAFCKPKDDLLSPDKDKKR